MSGPRPEACSCLGCAVRRVLAVDVRRHLVHESTLDGLHSIGTRLGICSKKIIRDCIPNSSTSWPVMMVSLQRGIGGGGSSAGTITDVAVRLAPMRDLVELSHDDGDTLGVELRAPSSAHHL